MTKYEYLLLEPRARAKITVRALMRAGLHGVPDGSGGVHWMTPTESREWALQHLDQLRVEDIPV